MTALSRNPERASERLGVHAERWDLLAGPAPASAVAARDSVINLAGEPVAQRWSAEARERIRSSRVRGRQTSWPAWRPPIHDPACS